MYKEVTKELILRNFFSVIIFSTTFLHRRCDLKRPVSQIIIPQISIFPCCLGLLNFAKPIFIPFTVVQEEIE